MAKVLITGGSGLVGRAISELLLNNSHEPVWLSRERGQEGVFKKYKWDIHKGHLDDAAFEHVDHVIHLAGAGVFDKRWTTGYKKEIIASRVKSSELLFDYVSKNAYHLKSFVGASAVGYYGADINDKLYSENDSPGTDFLANVCKAWEASYLPFADSGIRVAVVRSGVALSKHGGAYPRLRKLFRLGAGARLGSGRQNFPWIHIDDLAAIYVHLLFHGQAAGPFNAVGPEAVTNSRFTTGMAKSVKRPLLLPPVPSLALRCFLGESASALTKGVTVDPSKVKASGYRFVYPSLEKALTDLAQ